jgi:hypothetical protein
MSNFRFSRIFFASKKRFGDGYIMIAFGGGYVIVISTYHKEIGEVC